MITELSAFLATTAGKLVASTAVAAVSLGGAHATNLIDLPLMADQPTTAVVTADAEVTDDDVPEADGVASDPVADGSEPAADDVTAEEPEGDRFGVEAEGDDAEGDRFGVEAEGDDAEGDRFGVEADGDAVSDDESDKNDDPNHGSIVSEFAHTTELEGCERGQAIAEIASSNAADHRQNGERDTDKCGAETDDDTDVDDADDDTETEDEAVTDDESDESDENDDANHGSIVSEFAHTTELEGCERGQAIAEIASSNAADHRQNGERDTDKCGAETDDDTDVDDTETEGVAAVDISAGAEAGQAVTEVEATTGPGNSNNQGGGRPDHAGPPENAGRPDHAGGQGRGNK